MMGKGLNGVWEVVKLWNLLLQEGLQVRFFPIVEALCSER